MTEYDQDTRGNLDEFFGGPVPENQPDNQNQQVGNDSYGSEDLFSVPEQEYEHEEIPTQDAQKNKNNDEVRYEYFQSQYDKERARNDELTRKMAEMEAMIRTQQQPPQQAPAPEPEEEFPDFNIPEPKQPYGFNLQEAYTDPSSESAKFLQAKEEYRDKLIQYNMYRTQYVEAKASEKLANQEQMFKQYQMQMQQEQETHSKVNSVINDVQRQFGASPEEARDFVAKMGDNSIYNLENMYKFYKTVLTPAQQQQQQQYGQYAPSQQFNQYQRSQSMPNTMGVLSQNQQVNSNPVKNFMDELLRYSNKRNLKWN